ncbi:MAG TPA: ABC transporter ATP-binding protein [Gammaproteobacteria bacterium]|nr:ABC transporter ATP-binding protein [Gammaproteobacteria bacterium]
MIVHADNVFKKFGRFDALRGLSFSVPEGSAFALIGANGAGKTTTIKVLMNIIAPTTGDATVLGVNTRAVSPKELAQIGYVSENQHMPGRMTVSAYLDYLRPFYASWDRALEADLLGQLRLPPERRIKDLSHGMRLKMALACALPFRPKLLVLDEPFSGLDPLVRDELLERLMRHAGEMTILISSHELAEIELLTTHVAFLDGGRLLFQEAMSDLTARLRKVLVTLDAAAHAPAQTPKEWLEVRAVGNLLSFVDTRFSEQDLTARVAAVVGKVRHITTEPIALRSIYTTLARAVRDESART